MTLRHWIAALLPLLSAASVAQAGQLVDVQIIDRENGSSLPLYSHHAKQYVAGAPGHRYSVRIVNTTNQRVLTVLSVDGVNAISGETAAAQQTGYVLNPYESTEVAGWRKNMNEIAAFEFTTLSDSYAAETGRPNNVGVIGVAVFRERLPPPPKPPQYPTDKIAKAAPRAEAGRDSFSAPPAPPAPPAPAATTTAPPAGVAADAAASPSLAGGARESRAAKQEAEESLGTGHGDRESSRATYTNFERASSQPAEVVSIWYDSYAKLQARGIVPKPPRPRPQEPQPFPESFVPDPPHHH